MKNFFVITNFAKAATSEAAKNIKKYLEERGAVCTLSMRQEGGEHSFRYTDPRLIGPEVECVIVLGGDGTVLQAARDLVDLEIPLFGINLGTLGYLAEVDSDHIEMALDRLLQDQFHVEKRMMLHGVARHLNRNLLEDVALNDIVISRSGRIRIMDFDIFVNGRLLNSYSADGIIISTPTGSTGYSLSVGGPIIDPSASMLMITPIAPHTLAARSVVLSDQAKVEVVIRRRNDKTEEAEATFDGDTIVKLDCNDSIRVEKSGCTVKLIRLEEISFLEVLRKKMSSK